MEDPILKLRMLKGEADKESVVDEKKPTTFYLPSNLVKKFKSVCGPGNASTILETLIRNFIEASESETSSSVF